MPKVCQDVALVGQAVAGECDRNLLQWPHPSRGAGDGDKGLGWQGHRSGQDQERSELRQLLGKEDEGT